ncbi:MAG: carboxylating nicotinate-nucleotide diphosphorylase [Cellvibrionales bacterium]|nr:carboxylating nicotinate-nucleotide diphosphorylase [Cellvibrionales bacterium]
MNQPPAPPDYFANLVDTVRLALAEDLGGGAGDVDPAADISAALIPAAAQANAAVITREAAIVCGRPWVDEVFRQIDAQVALHWQLAEGAEAAAGQVLVEISGRARSILTAERCALNFLQTLMGTATAARAYAKLAAGAPTRVLDTRKTLPGLRLAQKYAVKTGGCDNHRMGLYDAFLIKENHIRACGGIAAVVARARQIAADKPVAVEVENLTELAEAQAAGADRILLDNFSAADCRRALARKRPGVAFERSGNIDADSLCAVIGEGIDFVSSGALCKNVRAIDLSLRFEGA